MYVFSGAAVALPVVVLLAQCLRAQSCFFPSALAAMMGAIGADLLPKMGAFHLGVDGTHAASPALLDFMLAFLLTVVLGSVVAVLNVRGPED